GLQIKNKNPKPPLRPNTLRLPIILGANLGTGVPLMDVGFAISCSLARLRRPQIQFLSIGPRVCSSLLSDLASQFSPCALLSLRLHQAVKRTFTSKLSNMLGTQQKGAR